MPRLSVVIPVYNEARTLPEVLRRVRAAALPVEVEIVIVDDGSTDGTRESLSPAPDGCRVVLHAANLGKGAALRSGLAAATGDYLVIQDADLEYDPADLPALLAPLLDGRADVVYGSRFLGGPHRVHLFWHYAANRLFTLLANVLYNVNLNDMGTGYKAFRMDALRAIPLEADGFGVEAEITAKVCKRGLRLYEVPVSYSGRSYSEGKKITWRDGFGYLYYLLRYRVSD